MPSLHVESHRHKIPDAYQSFVDEKNGFSKPFQFSKLVDELASTKNLHREVHMYYNLEPQPQNQ